MLRLEIGAQNVGTFGGWAPVACKSGARAATCRGCSRHLGSSSHLKFHMTRVRHSVLLQVTKA